MIYPKIVHAREQKRLREKSKWNSVKKSLIGENGHKNRCALKALNIKPDANKLEDMDFIRRDTDPFSESNFGKYRTLTILHEILSTCNR